MDINILLQDADLVAALEVIDVADNEIVFEVPGWVAETGMRDGLAFLENKVNAYAFVQVDNR